MKIKALFLLASTCSLAVSSAQQPNLHLQGDGHACSGYLHARQGHLRWKSSFSTCDATYQVKIHEEGNWTLELHKRAGSPACSFAIVTIRQTNGQVEYPLWEVQGFQSAANLAATPPTPALDCNMQSISKVTHPAKTR